MYRNSLCYSRLAWFGIKVWLVGLYCITNHRHIKHKRTTDLRGVYTFISTVYPNIYTSMFFLLAGSVADGWIEFHFVWHWTWSSTPFNFYYVRNIEKNNRGGRVQEWMCSNSPGLCLQAWNLSDTQERNGWKLEWKLNWCYKNLYQ